ncbi:MAG: hypothetical protein KJ623_03115 [Nanoarchaeota archaeon]|nr:hypothetical protein [Nanoarchaeota archaeon]MBU0962579.1 hypothetical protein [Nanoarchaeota archaeon]
MIPILIVGKDLSDLADELTSQGIKDGILAFSVKNSEEALGIFEELGPKLMLTILGKNEQKSHDKLISEGYKGSFVVYSNENESEWGKRKVEFIKPQSENLYNKLIKNLIYN